MIGGNLRSFVDLGAPMADLLLRLRGQEAEREYAEYIDQILAAFPDEVRAKQTSEFAATRIDHQPQKTTLIEPLTTRELQVLKLLATDLSRQEIADKLYISPGTLHVHTKNIYRKLDVHKRTEAVQIAKEFGIL
jgi:LuxR family maltose regulon positive regulatory protein